MSVTPPESVYALDVSKLLDPAITVFGAKLDGTLVGVGALRVLDYAASQGLTRVSLETGNYEEFAPARRLYESFGFTECEVFADYMPSPISVCMTKLL